MYIHCAIICDNNYYINGFKLNKIKILFMFFMLGYQRVKEIDSNFIGKRPAVQS